MQIWMLILAVLFVFAFWVRHSLPSLDGSRAPAAPAEPAVAVSTASAKPVHVVLSADPEAVAQRGRAWVAFRGKAFDLLSLEPAAGLRLLFRDAATGEESAATTDAKGAFDAGLPVTDTGYDLSMDLQGARRGYREDWTPSLRTLPEEQRAEVAADRVKPERIFVSRGRAVRKDFAVFAVKVSTAEPEEAAPASEPPADD